MNALMPFIVYDSSCFFYVLHVLGELQYTVDGSRMLSRLDAPLLPTLLCKLSLTSTIAGHVQ